MSIVTILLRFLPFLIWSGKRKTPPYILYLGRVLPPAIIGMLVIYCLKDISFAAHYLKVSDSFYAIQDGMLKSQSPTYRIKNAGDAVIVVNQRGDSLFYEGEP